MQFLSQILQSNCTLQLFLTKTLKLKNNHMAFSGVFWLNNEIMLGYDKFFDIKNWECKQMWQNKRKNVAF